MPSLEDSTDTLPGIIKSLAQQVSSRDAQIISERATHIDKLSVMKEQYDAVRAERDCSQQSAKQIELQRKQLEEDLNKVTAAFHVEKAEFLKRIELLEQAATHKAELLDHALREVQEWKALYTTAADSSRQWEECFAQLSRMTNKLDEVSGARHQSDSGSSPTLVSSESPNKPTSAPKAPPSEPVSQPDVFNPKPNNSIATPTRAASPVLQTRMRASNAIPASDSSVEKSHPTPSHLREVYKSGGVKSPHQSSRKQYLTGNAEHSPASTSQHPRKPSEHLILPPDRVIHTAHYEIKEEDDVDDDLSYPEDSISKDLFSRADDDDIDVPNAKRRKIMRQRSVGRIEDDEQDQEDGDEVYHQVEVRNRRCQSQEGLDFDEMAIGAEDNHKEVYGFRKVRVRNVNPRQDVSSSQRTRNVPQARGSSDNRHKVDPPRVASNGRNVPAKTRR
ncbi:hypothetical protein JB92DRAFT_2867039 [Gautieria morchelliformis]|nr:hypothetical protein JB92DRAFT_2867039 [Gautieria morchelliformis]